MDIFASRNSGIPSLFTEIAADSKGTIGTGTTTSPNTMAVAVEDMWGEIPVDGPFMERLFECQETWEDLTFGYGSHACN
jgi:hypothetical protein